MWYNPFEFKYDAKGEYHHPNKYPAAMRTVKSWKKYRFIGFYATMREEIDKTWIEPETWEDGKKAAYAYVPLLVAFMKQVEEGQMEKAAGNAFYLLECLGRLFCKNIMLFEPNEDSRCSFYEFLLEAVCHILSVAMTDKRTGGTLEDAMIWHINTINMLYGRIFESSYTSYSDFLGGKVDKDSFAWGYEYLVIGPSAFVTD